MLTYAGGAVEGSTEKASGIPNGRSLRLFARTQDIVAVSESGRAEKVADAGIAFPATVAQTILAEGGRPQHILDVSGRQWYAGSTACSCSRLRHRHHYGGLARPAARDRGRLRGRGRTRGGSRPAHRHPAPPPARRHHPEQLDGRQRPGHRLDDHRPILGLPANRFYRARCLPGCCPSSRRAGRGIAVVEVVDRLPRPQSAEEGIASQSVTCSTYS